MTTKLTSRRLAAIIDALNEKLAGALDAPREDYEKALEWAYDEEARRALRRKVKT